MFEFFVLANDRDDSGDDNDDVGEGRKLFFCSSKATKLNIFTGVEPETGGAAGAENRLPSPSRQSVRKLRK